MAEDSAKSRYWDQWSKNFLGESSYGRPQGMGPVRLRIVHDILGRYPERGKLLDAGCAVGHNTLTFIDAGWDTRAIDFSTGMVGETQTRLKGAGHDPKRVQQASVTDLNLFPHNEFDAVVSIGVLYYVEEIDKALGEIARILKPGGVFIGSFYNELFDLVTFNRYTLEFFKRNFYPLLDKREETAARKLDDALAALVTNPEAPKRHDKGSARDDTFTRSENPLTFGRRLASFGLIMEGQPYYYRLHLVPPLVQGQIPELAEEAEAKQYALRQDWRAMFLGAHFLVEARKQ